MKIQKRDRYFALRLTREEFKSLQSEARKRGMTLSQVVRASLGFGGWNPCLTPAPAPVKLKG